MATIDPLLVLRLTSRFMEPRDLCRLETLCRACRWIGSEGWEINAKNLGLKVGENQSAKQAVVRFERSRQFSKTCLHSAEEHGYFGRNTVSCDGQNCQLPEALDTGRCYANPDSFDFFLHVSYGDQVWYKGFTRCLRMVDKPQLQQFTSAEFRFDLEIETSGPLAHYLDSFDPFDAGDNRLEDFETNWDGFRVVVTCVEKKSSEPKLVYATAIGDDWDNEFFGNGRQMTWSLQVRNVLTHGNDELGGRLEGDIFTVGKVIKAIQFSHYNLVNLGYYYYD